MELSVHDLRILDPGSAGTGAGALTSVCQGPVVWFRSVASCGILPPGSDGRLGASGRWRSQAGMTLLMRQWRGCRDAGRIAMHGRGVALPGGVFD